MQANQLNKNTKNDSMAPLSSKSEQILALEDAARKDPQNSQILTRLGRLLVESQKFDKAVGVHQKIFELEPHDPRNSNSLGVTLMIAGYQTQAIEYLKKAASLAPDNFVFKANLGKAYMMARQWREALECIDHVLAMSGGNGSEQLAALRQECLANLPAASQETHDAVSQNISEAGIRNEGVAEAKPQQDTLVPEQQTGLAQESVSFSSIDTSDKSQLKKSVFASLADRATEILKDKKILHAPFEIAGNMARCVRYLREMGIEADDANYYDTWLQFKNSISLNINSMPENQRLQAIGEFAAKAMDKYDIFHFHFGQSLFPDLRDLPELARRGKKILFSFWGSDQRSPEVSFYNQAKFLGFDPPKPYYLTLRNYSIHKVVNRYADMIYAATGVPRGFFNQGTSDTSQWDIESKNRYKDLGLINKDPDKLYVLHAPTNASLKGTNMLVGLLQECVDEGMPIQLISFGRRPLDEARKLYAYADCAIDQVGAGTFGLFSIEMMCWEIPVLVYQTDLFRRVRNNPPVISITKENFKENILKLVEWKRSGQLREHGQICRKYATEHCDIDRVGIPNYVSAYCDIIEGKKIKQYINKSWYEEEFKLQSGVKSDFYRYMIEKNVFQQIGMEIPQYDHKLYS